jgi:hypothetical protein
MADLTQILKGTSATLRQTFYVDGATLDLDTGVPTVTVTRPDGTTISSGTVSHVGAVNSGTYSFILAAQPNETLLTITWAGTIGGQPQTLTTYLEVVGAHLFTLSALRAMKVAGGMSTPFSDTVAWPDAQLLDTRTEVLEEFTDILGYSPVPRFAREVHSGDYTGQVILNNSHALRLLSVSVGGVAQSLSAHTLTSTGILQATANYLPSGWYAYGASNVVVEYTHGLPRVPGDGSDVAMLRAAMKLQPGLGSTANTVMTPDGSSYSFDPAGQVTRAGVVRYYGVPAIDSWLQRMRDPSLAVA